MIAYTLWGFLPIYFKLVDSVTSSEVVAHRIIWAIPFGALIIAVRGQWPEIRRALTHRQMMLWLLTTAMLIAINWYVYVFAVQTGRIFQASLGYYINPLIFVLAGVVFFAERLGPLQKSAVLLAAVGVGVLTISGGEFPWIALVIGTTFAMYGVIRKRVVIGAMPGLFLETAILLPFALAYLSYLAAIGQAGFIAQGAGIAGLLLLAGPFTVVPLVLFSVAARRVTLTTLGFMQFIGPSLQFMTGIYYGEQLTPPRIICFLCIWAAVVLFVTDALRKNKKGPEPSGSGP